MIANRDSEKSPGQDEARATDGEELSPGSSSGTLEKWNKPGINIYRFVASNWCFIVMGMNDGAVGVSRGFHAPNL